MRDINKSPLGIDKFEPGHHLTAPELDTLRQFIATLRSGVECTGPITADMSVSGLALTVEDPYPKLYGAVSDGSGGEITLQMLTVSGDLQGAEEVYPTLGDGGSSSSGSSSSSSAS